MTTLFNVEQYQQTSKRDWDDVKYDPAWDEPNNIAENLHSEVSAVVEHSAVVEVLEEGEEISSDRWNPAHFGETPRKVDLDGNPTIFWDESIEPPLPDDFKSSQEYEKAWQQWEENSDRSICAAGLERDFPSRDLSPERLNYADSAKSTSGVKKDCAIASPTSQSTTTLENSQKSQESTASPRRHRANPLPLKENAWVEPITETAYPQYCESSTQSNPNTFVSKTYPDCYQHLDTQEKNPAHISNRCSGSFASVGMMHNGLLLERDLNLEPSGLVKDSYSLPRPGALSCSGNGRPPGTTKSEAKAKKLGILQKNEVFNPEWLEQEFGLPIGWTDPQEHRAATELLERVEQPLEISSTPELQRSPGSEYSTLTFSALVKEPAGEYSTTTSSTLKAISLWQPWASLITLGLKHYETRSWKTKYRGKLLICSTAKNSKHYREYLKVKDKLQLPPWDETNFPHGCVIAICDLVDCIEITSDFINQQSQTEILCGDWQVGRYAWKLENIQPITEPFAVKGKQRLFNVSSTNFESYLKKKNFTSTQQSKKGNKKSDCWYTPLHIVDLVVRVLGTIDLDPCADDGKHIRAAQHYTFDDDGLAKPWHGKIYMNPPYSHPGLWMKKLQAEMESGRVTEAIALVPAATDTKWLSPLLKSQPVCFWTGRIKFLGEDYQPKSAARQSHVLVYWGKNWQRFKDVFEPHGFVSVPSKLLGDKQSSSPSNLDSSPSKTELSPSKNSPSNLLGDKEKSSPSNSSSNLLGDKEKSSPSKIDLSPELSNPSNLLGDKEKNSPSKNASPSKKRLSGKGNGYIHWRSITKNGKEYPQAYYHWREGCKKRSKYIPKKLLGSVEEADSIKRPVIEILKLLGVETSPSKLLGDEENNPSNNVSADISDSTEKLLGDKWIKNGEINVSQGVEVSPSNLDNSPSKIDLSPSKRRKGDGSGSIHWRTITRGRKDYPQAYYHYEVWKDGDRLVKSSKYIPKRLLSQVQRLEAEKAPIKEILRLLGVVE
ncbi:MAG: DNA N-6-adenine-methyltransferase [Cyanobacteria bacterium P01_D01_bin.116]